MARLQIRELSDDFGVEILGLEPKIPLPDEEIAQLRALFDTKALLVIRDLDIDLRFQAYLSHLLIGKDPLDDPDESLDVLASRREQLVSNREPQGTAPFGRLLFHSDSMWRDDIFRLISLYGVSVEEPTSPTLFVSASHAWRTLPEDLRSKVEGRFAVHGMDATYRGRAAGDANVLVSTFGDEKTIRLPIGHHHPHTGATLLFVAQQMTHYIDGLAQGDSEALLGALFDHFYRSEAVLEHHWRERDLVLWDNIALQHARPNIRLDGPARTLRKIFAPTPVMTAEQRPLFSTVGS